MSVMIDRAARLAIRHERALTIAGIAWLTVSWAISARFIPLPDVPQFWKTGFFWAGVAYNATWWGFLRPRIAARKAQIRGTETPDARMEGDRTRGSITEGETER